MSVSEVEIQADELVIDLRDPAPAPLVAAPITLPALGPPPSRYATRVKPVIDRVLAAVLLVTVAPVLLVLAVVIRVEMGPGVLFRQERIGEGGRRFTLLKFRTMLPERRQRAVALNGPDRRRSHKSDDDPRHTELGRFLRRWSLDELPQLVNVLRGEMSMVGPRPELPSVVARYEPWEHARHVVKPGVTGFWQTRARALGPTHLFTQLDLEYVEALSPMTDLKILLRTVPAALGSQKGS